MSSCYYNTYWSGEVFQPRNDAGAQVAGIIEQYAGKARRCLDVGCGDGRTLGSWLSARLGYHGVDISEEAIKLARSRGLQASLIEDAAVLPFSDGEFDLVICTEVLEHLFAPHEALREIRRVLEPGGVFIATVPNAAYWRRRLDLAVLGRWNPLGDPLAVEQPWRDPHIRFFTLPALQRLAEHCGLVVATVGGHGGSVVGDLPIPRRWRHQGSSSPAYRALERWAPSLLGYRLYVVARNPEGGSS
jgi:methionine biosynthesis protein MetW